MPTYNRGDSYLKHAINSVIEQSYKNWELIITDDCSIDNSYDIVKSYSLTDKRITLFKLDKNRGAGYARNNSIKNSNGRFISFCDSDDQWKPNKLKTQLKYMLKHKYHFTCSAFDVINENGKYIETIYPPKKLTFNKLLTNNYIGCLTAIYDTKYLGKIYMSSIRNRQDWVLWLNILKKIKVTHTLKESLAIYRKRSDSISSNKIKMIRFHWRVYYEELNFSFIKSFFCLINNILFHLIKKYN